MASLSLANIRKSYNAGPEVIKGIDLNIRDGEFMVFVGPSGCGKSTLLRMIAGLEEISSGELRIGGELVNNVEPAHRGVAMVFQSYALYPHMTARENMGFALKLAGTPAAQIRKAVDDVAEILHVTHLLERKPKALSGGERQRVAIGRAIVRKPAVFLFDEPLSNLDAALRVQMRIELSKLHKELGTTMIYVTHDQVEAMTLGDRIAVFNQGRIEQLGEPLELYERPQNQFVAGFLGSPRMNFVPCSVAEGMGGCVRVVVGGGNGLVVASPAELRSRSGDFALGVRPEHLHIVAPDDGLRASVDLVEHLGDCEIAYAKLEGVDRTVAVKLQGGRHALKAGDVIGLRPEPGKSVLFGSQGGRAATL